MPWAHSDTLDGGLLAIKNNVIRAILIDSFAPGDSYATVLSNALATVVVAPADLVISADGTSRKLQLAAGKTANASVSAPAGPLFIAFTNGVDKVYWVADESTDQAITAPNPVNFPQSIYRSNQPANA